MVQLACEKFYREQKAPNLQVKANSIGVSQNSNRGEEKNVQLAHAKRCRNLNEFRDDKMCSRKDLKEHLWD